MKNLQSQLKKMYLKEDNMLRKHVIDYLLEQGESEEIEGHIKDILNHGCQSGTVSELIYYSNTHAFFDRYYDEIEDLREEYEDSTGIQLEIKGDLKNWLAWYSFEETLYRIAEELEIE